jgi:hypothetical protein
MSAPLVWRGRYAGPDGSGALTLTIDALGARGSGQLLIGSDDPARPALLAGVPRIALRGAFQARTAWIAALHPDTGYPGPWEQLHKRFPAWTRMPIHAELAGRWGFGRVTLGWTTNLGDSGHATLTLDGGWWPALRHACATLRRR